MLLAEFIEIDFPIIAVVGIVAVVLLGLLIWGIKTPMVWRLLSVLGVGTGAGFLVWGIMMASMSEQPPYGSPAAVIAIGAGVLVGAIALLVISYCGCRTARRE